MKFQTMSLVAGTLACNARCPFCISGQTPYNGVDTKDNGLNLDRLRKACMIAEKGGVNTVLITGKGEPTLFPEHITQYLTHKMNGMTLEDYFPLIELQTHAMNFHKQNKETGDWVVNSKLMDHLIKWREYGLTTVIISITHWEEKMLAKTYTQGRPYPPLAMTIAFLHEMGFAVRLSCVGCKGFVDTPEKMMQLIDFAKDNGVEQLTWRPVRQIEFAVKDQVAKDTALLAMTDKEVKAIHAKIMMNGHKILELLHGAEVFDVHGQNICLSNCITRDTNDETIRQLIFFPDGHLRYDWEYEGAIII